MNLDEYFMETLLGAMKEADVSAEGILQTKREFEDAVQLGMKWVEQWADSDASHRETTLPLYLLMTTAIGNVVGAVNPRSIALYSVASAVVNIAVWKGYEKGKREALASLVLEGSEDD